MTRLALLVTLIVAAALRFHRIGLPVLTSDEAFSWRLIRYPLPDMLRRAALDVHPPLYYFVLDIWERLFGGSPASLRSLSAVLGVVAVAMAYAVCTEALRLSGSDGGRARWGGVLAAFLVAIQAATVGHGRNARMYALAIALGALSCWLLLRAMRGPAMRPARWIAYGLAVAAFCATHYYAFFTVAAQALFVWFLRRPAGSPSGSPRRHLLAALAVAALVFAPWVPVMLRQAAQVREGYWIPAPSLASLGWSIVHWAAGAELGGAGAAAVLACLAVLALLLGWAWLRGGPGARLLLLQALLPWVLGIAVSIAGGRPIVLERYMAFGQFFLICAWGAAWACLADARIRAASAALAVAISGAGLFATWPARYPDRPPAFAHAARYLKRQAAPGDLVLVRSPRALNKLRAYGEIVDASRLDVKFLATPSAARDDHFSHLPSLDSSDLTAADPFLDHSPRTIWRVEDVRTAPEPAPPGWAITHARMFEGGDAPVILIGGYAPASTPSPR